MPRTHGILQSWPWPLSKFVAILGYVRHYKKGKKKRESSVSQKARSQSIINKPTSRIHQLFYTVGVLAYLATTTGRRTVCVHPCWLTFLLFAEQ